MPHLPIPPAWHFLLWTADLVVPAAALALAGRSPSGAWPAGPALLVPLLALPLAAVAVLASGAAGAPLLPLPRAAVRRSAAAGLATIATAGAAAWLCGLSGTWGWPALAAAAVIATALPVALRLAAWLALRRHAGRRCLLVGTADCRRRLRDHLASHPVPGLAVVAEVGPGVDPLACVPTIGLDGLEDAVTAFQADEVLLSTGLDDRLIILEVMARLIERPLAVRYVPDPEALPLFCPRPADVGGLPAIDLSASPLSPAAELVKWLEDKAVSLAALAVLALPMLAIAAAIKLTSPGPVLFAQLRHGRYGRPILVYKFRTMATSLCSSDVSTGAFRQAARDDPRVTRLGRFLRNTSLDELPQFLNVLRGDMSVVGPRPHAIAHNRRYVRDIGELMRRHYVKPGITGLAQISGSRGETRTVEDMRRRINLDLQYLRGWSLWLDVKIIARTLVGGWINKHP